MMTIIGIIISLTTCQFFLVQCTWATTFRMISHFAQEGLSAESVLQSNRGSLRASKTHSCNDLLYIKRRRLNHHLRSSWPGAQEIEQVFYRQATVTPESTMICRSAIKGLVTPDSDLERYSGTLSIQTIYSIREESWQLVWHRPVGRVVEQCLPE